MKLEGKVALITGSGQGIGRMTALTLAREGANIVLNDIEDERLHMAEVDVKEIGVETLAVKADVSRSEQVAQMVDQAVQKFGTVDILVNNVGVGIITGGGIELPDDQFKRLIDINLKAPYLTSYYTVPHMKKQRSGKIVNISSAAGKYRAAMADLAYTTAKAGVLGLTRFLASELGPHGINVNCVVPGNVLTEQGQKDWDSLPEEKREAITMVTPLRRMASMQDLANVIHFLVSDASEYITGVSLDVNGGWWMS